MPQTAARHALELLERRVPFCLVTVIRSHPGTGVDVGAKLVVEQSGDLHGSLGSHGLDETAARLAREQIQSGDIRLVRVSIDGVFLGERRARRTQETELGTVELALEPMLPPDHLIIAGAGHIALPLAKLAGTLGFEVTVIDDRARFASPDRFPGATLLVDDFRTAIASQDIGRSTYLVLVTRGHEHDEATLQQVVGSDAAYIGMIGSRRRVLVVFERLRAMGVPEQFIDRIYAPIGLDIGARTPEEIALAILAEIVTVKRRGRAPSLRELLPRAAGV